MKKSILCVTALVETSPQALPLGAACICSAINHSSETKEIFSANLMDFSLEKSYDLEKISADICSCKDLYAVSFSVYVWNRKVLEDLCGLVKSKKPDVITIAGGPEVTANPCNFINFDWLTAGEGEGVVVNLLADLAGGRLPELRGVYRNDGLSDKCVSGEVMRAMPCPVENLSSPYLDGTLDVKKYGGALWELARGCPFKCSYCYESRGEKKIKYFPIERLEKELDYFARNKVPQVFVLDPTYNAGKQRALDMLRLIKKKTPDTFYYFEARAEFIDRQLAQAFAEIPCSLQFGLQSADEEVLKKVNRT
ncbi:MAG: radical SAM protein, partial [Treponema sp.]|nr:radical SAM protein [Candidatus Treponema equi]